MTTERAGPPLADAIAILHHLPRAHEGSAGWGGLYYIDRGKVEQLLSILEPFDAALARPHELRSAIQEAMSAMSLAPHTQAARDAAGPLSRALALADAVLAERETLLARCEALEALLDAAAPLVCPSCNPGRWAKIDEDGCCVVCGSECFDTQRLAARSDGGTHAD